MKIGPRFGRGPWEERNWKHLEPLPNKTSRAHAQVPHTTPERLLTPAHETQHDLASTTWPFERAVTLDLDEAPWPPPGTGWHVARRANGSTVWRRVSLQPCEAIAAWPGRCCSTGGT
jgi:hypothetical protein